MVCCPKPAHLFHFPLGDSRQDTLRRESISGSEAVRASGGRLIHHMTHRRIAGTTVPALCRDKGGHRMLARGNDTSGNAPRRNILLHLFAHDWFTFPFLKTFCRPRTFYESC